jgi:ubiquinol-cytochrome c reductase cytochrome b subunit
VLFTEGTLRIFPPWEISIAHTYLIPPAFWASPLFLPLIHGLAGAYPWIERKFTKDNALHNLLQRPRDVPVRTSDHAHLPVVWECGAYRAASARPGQRR